MDKNAILSLARDNSVVVFPSSFLHCERWCDLDRLAFGAPRTRDVGGNGVANDSDDDVVDGVIRICSSGVFGVFREGVDVRDFD